MITQSPVQSFSCRHCGFTVPEGKLLCPFCGVSNARLLPSRRTLAKIVLTVVEPAVIWVVMTRIFS